MVSVLEMVQVELYDGTMDFAMLKMDGYQATQAIRKLEGEHFQNVNYRLIGFGHERCKDKCH